LYYENVINLFLT